MEVFSFLKRYRPTFIYATRHEQRARPRVDADVSTATVAIAVSEDDGAGPVKSVVKRYRRHVVQLPGGFGDNLTANPEMILTSTSQLSEIYDTGAEGVL